MNGLQLLPSNSCRISAAGVVGFGFFFFPLLLKTYNIKVHPQRLLIIGDLRLFLSPAAYATVHHHLKIPLLHAPAGASATRWFSAGRHRPSAGA